MSVKHKRGRHALSITEMTTSIDAVRAHLCDGDRAAHGAAGAHKEGHLQLKVHQLARAEDGGLACK